MRERRWQRMDPECKPFDGIRQTIHKLLDGRLADSLAGASVQPRMPMHAGDEVPAAERQLGTAPTQRSDLEVRLKQRHR
jgi:hypothetical protein